jgi:hypothetical protein
MSEIVNGRDHLGNQGVEGRILKKSKAIPLTGRGGP